MSCSKWLYDPKHCDGIYCCGECDDCHNRPEPDEDDEDGEE